ncbi:MAG: lipase family alpha/beta hydrolase [Solirubrobacterales bacterium]
MRRSSIAAAAVAAILALPAAGHAAFAPPDLPGPPLSVPPHKLAAALECHGGVAQADRASILLVPGTTLTPQVEYSWNWEPALTELGRPFCTVTLPDKALGDVQVAGEYVVYAIRTMHARSNRRVDVIGHSQGGMVPRWALRFWPGTRRMVDDVIGMSPSNHGTVDAVPACTAGCAPAFWQQRTGSNFPGALNSYEETFPGISYTSVYTRTMRWSSPTSGPRPPRHFTEAEARSPTSRSRTSAQLTHPSTWPLGHTTTRRTRSRSTRSPIAAPQTRTERRRQPAITR